MFTAASLFANQPTNQPTNQPVSQSVSQSVSQPIHRQATIFGREFLPLSIWRGELSEGGGMI
ncbi:hypothetical protein D3M96_06990 [Alcaligenes aquatilis]|uniref:Uncharacterized protein n=1 Tax=Alcaligenes aquatilis TaxID=323284 RepID=A0A3G2HT31_9BURK|nr:hypothetical protein D3M96_06990 [Alcaligenes aquatilis]